MQCYVPKASYNKSAILYCNWNFQSQTLQNGLVNLLDNSNGHYKKHDKSVHLLHRYSYL